MKFQRTGLELTFDITRSILVKFMKENTHIHSIFDIRKSVSVYLMRENIHMRSIWHGDLSRCAAKVVMIIQCTAKEGKYSVYCKSRYNNHEHDMNWLGRERFFGYQIVYHCSV